MPSYGLSASGFLAKPQAQILTDMQTVQLAQISSSLDVTPTSLIGILNGIVSADLADLWNLGAALYSGMDPSFATGDQLTSLSLITGTARAPATYTVVTGVQITTTGAVNQSAGTMFASVAGNPTALFTNQSSFVVGGAGTYSATFIAVNSGAVQCLSNTLTVIAVPVSNWTAVNNPTAGVMGSPIQTDSSLRVARQAQLSSGGSSTAAAIQALVLQRCQPGDSTYATTTSTLNCTVLYNDTDTTDGNGLLPHSIEVIAYQPGNTSADDLALANLIAAYKPAGINTNGTTSKNVTDSQGIVETIKLTRPSTVTVNVAVGVVTNPSTYGGNATVQTAITNYASGNTSLGISPAWVPGANAYYIHTQAAAFAAGVVDLTSFTLNGGTSTVAIAVRQVAVLGSITVTP